MNAPATDPAYGPGEALLQAQHCLRRIRKMEPEPLGVEIAMRPDRSSAPPSIICSARDGRWRTALQRPVLAVVNLALLMWLIPDELGDEVWAPRRGRGRGRRQPSDFQAVTEPTAVSTSAASATTADSPPTAPTATAQESGVHRRLPRPAVSGQPSQPGPTNLNVPIPQSASAPTRGAVLPRAAVPLAVAGLTAVMGFVVWIRRRRMLGGSPS